MANQNDVRVFIKKVQAHNWGSGNPAPAGEVKALNAEWATIKAALPADEQAAADRSVRSVLNA